MTEFVAAALFVYTDDTKHLIEPVQNNSLGTRITPVAFEALTQTPSQHLEGVDHVVVAGSLDVIKEVLHLAIQHGFSVGIIPTAKQKHLIRLYDLPADTPAAVALALRKDGQRIDLVLCNGKIMLFKAAINRCADPAHRECINGKIRSTTRFQGIMGYITIGSDGKAERPLFINKIEDGRSEFIVKVY